MGGKRKVFAMRWRECEVFHSSMYLCSVNILVSSGPMGEHITVATRAHCKCVCVSQVDSSIFSSLTLFPSYD